MTGIVFPSIANALMPLMQMDRQAENDRLQRERLDKHDEWMQEDRKQAREQHQLEFMSKLDTSQRAKMKEAAEYTAGTGMAILSAPPEQRGQMFSMALQDAQTRGYDTKSWPQQWSPQAESWLNFNVRKAQPIADYFKQEADRPQPMGSLGGAPASGSVPGTDIDRSGTAISGIESAGGPNNGYGAVGPVANSAGNRAYGKHQVMDFNIGPWTQEVFGKPMTPQEFLQNPQAQDAVFKHKFGQYIQQYGSPEAASRAWFAGPGGMNNPNAADVNGMTVAKYGQKFNVGFGGPQVADAGGFAPTQTPAQSIPGGLPQVAQGDAVAGQGDVMAPPRAPLPTTSGGAIEHDVLKQIQLPPGAQIVKRKGAISQPQPDSVEIMYPNGQLGIVRLPPKKEARQEGPKTLEERDRETVLRGDPADPAYAAAYAHIGAERVVTDPNDPTKLTRIKPDMSWARPPTFQGYAAGGTDPGGKAVTVEPGKGKPLDNSTRDEIRKQADPASALLRLVDSFDPSFAGYYDERLGNASNFAKRNLPDALGGADPKGQAQWWQDYANFANLERNKLFGAALSVGEQAAWKEAMVNPGMKPDQVKENLARQRDLAQKALSRIANSSVKSGYNQEAIEALIGRKVSDLPDPMGDVPHQKPEPKATSGAQGPRMSPADAAKLPPGTPFIGEDGVPRVRN